MALKTCTSYWFSYVGPPVAEAEPPQDQQGSDSVQNVNTFKKITGAFGLVSNKNNGATYANVPATFSDSVGNVLVTTTTDKDGFYGLLYTHKGKPALFTIKLGTGTGAVSRVVELKANGWTEASYDPGTGLWTVSVK